MSESKNSKKKLRNSSSLNEKDKYIIVRESSGMSPSLKSLNSVTIQEFFDSNNAFRIFYENHSCYDLVPDSSKLVVFDTSLNVQKAFYALIYNGVRAGILWDCVEQCYTGMFTITDFIKIICNEYDISGPDFDRFQHLETQDIATWRSQYNNIDCDFNEFKYVRPEDSLKQAVETLLLKRVHRLPVIDQVSGNPLHIITHKRILKFLHINLYHLPSPAFMGQLIRDIPIGTYGDVCTIRSDQSIITGLRMFLEKRVSALPVVDASGVLEDIYSKFDVIHLAVTRTYHLLDRNISEALEERPEKLGQVITCSKHDTLQNVIDLFNTHEVHRLVVVDAHRRVEGIVSLSDILAFFIREHPSE